MSVMLQKVLKLVPLIATVPEFFFATMTTVISNSYASLVEHMNHMKSIKLKDERGGFTDFCDTIFVDAERFKVAHREGNL